MSGYYVSIEGIDGAGTTTQARLLADIFCSSYSVYLTREPSDGDVGRLVRRYIVEKKDIPEEAMALLFAADRLTNYHCSIKPMRDSHALVISDRCVLSSLVYQQHTLHHLESSNWIAEINRFMIWPDLVVLIDIDAQTACERRQARALAMGHTLEEDRYEVMTLQHQLVQAYQKLIFTLPCATMLVDGALPKEVIAQQIAQKISTLLK